MKPKHSFQTQSWLWLLAFMWAGSAAVCAAANVAPTVVVSNEVSGGIAAEHEIVPAALNPR